MSSRCEEAWKHKLEARDDFSNEEKGTIWGRLLQLPAGDRNAFFEARNVYQALKTLLPAETTGQLYLHG